MVTNKKIPAPIKPASDTHAPAPASRRGSTITSRVLLVGVTVIVIVGIVGVLGGNLSLKGTLIAEEVKVEFPSPGTTLVKVGGQADKASFMLAASDLWANTGLVLEPNAKVIVSASGRVNLAVHRLVEAADLDIVPVNGWVGPGGSTQAVRTGHATYRRDLKIVPQAPDGTLLAYLHKQGEPIPSVDHPRPGSIVVVGHSGAVVNSTGESRTLWFIVNDAVLEDDEESKMSFLEVDNYDDPKLKSPAYGFAGRMSDPSGVKPRNPLQRWNYIRQNQYWGIWYDDNIGFYHIQMDFNVK